MSSSKRARLLWSGAGDAFEGSVGSGPEVVLDGDGEAGPSPMDAVLLGVMACMGIDVRMILEKGHVPLDSLQLEAEAERAEEAPRYYRRIELVYRLKGPGEENRARVERAVELSRDRYCSALHSLRSDLDLEIRIEAL